MDMHEFKKKFSDVDNDYEDYMGSFVMVKMLETLIEIKDEIQKFREFIKIYTIDVK